MCNRPRSKHTFVVKRDLIQADFDYVLTNQCASQIVIFPDLRKQKSLHL